MQQRGARSLLLWLSAGRAEVCRRRDFSTAQRALDALVSTLPRRKLLLIIPGSSKLRSHSGVPGVARNRLRHHWARTVHPRMAIMGNSETITVLRRSASG